MKSSEIIRKYGISPKKSFGQNFLINEDILEKIASFIVLENKNIIEVWPWYWALTERILQKNISGLDLVELDNKMIDILEDRIKIGDLVIWKTDFRINNIDVLKYDPKFKDYLVIANIPYYITSPILFRFLYEVANKPSEMIILMQKDVADKIRKTKWNKTSVLSLYIEYKCEEIKEIVKVWPGNFIPPPKVESSVLYFKLRQNPDASLDKDFIEIIKLWFSERRKKLISNLSKRYDKDNIADTFNILWLNPNIRAEELTLDNWTDIIKSLKK